MIKDNTPNLVIEAIRTLRMVAEPGDDLKAVLARAEKEAQIYIAFMANPKRIKSIGIFIKPTVRDVEPIQYVKQPRYVLENPEEEAGVLWHVARTDEEVLEVVIHCGLAAPIFPILRTYCDGVDSQECNLGLGRTLYFEMFEADTPGFTSVYIGFTPFPAKLAIKGQT